MWSPVTIEGGNADWFVPAKHRLGRTIVLLPPYSGLGSTRDTDWGTVLEQFECACLTPRRHACWWVDRLQQGFSARHTPEVWLMECVVPWLRRTIGGTSFGLLGLGTGGHAALRLAFRHPDVFSAVASIAGVLDMHDEFGNGNGLESIYPSKEACRLDTAVLHLNPARFPEAIRFVVDLSSPMWRGNDRLVEKLTATGIPHTAEFTSKGILDSQEYARSEAIPSIAFLTAALDRIGRRLL